MMQSMLSEYINTVMLFVLGGGAGVSRGEAAILDLGSGHSPGRMSYSSS